MRKITIVFTTLLCCLYLISVNSVIAIYSETFNDEIGDVIDALTEEEVDDQENYDIKTIIVERDYRRVTLKISVQGVIENKGNINFLDEEYLYSLDEEFTDPDDLLELFSQNMTSYLINLLSPTGSYMIIYVNKSVIVYGGDDETDLIKIDNTHSVNEGNLTINFNLMNSRENLTDISVEVSEGGILGNLNYYDDFYDILNDQAPVGGNSDNSDTNNDGIETGMILIIGLIITIIVIGLGVLIYILRR
jgi:hypothetical protein